MTLTSGRWEITRALKTMSKEQLLDRIFDKTVILCRETFKYENTTDIPWASMLETLRVWEYTGRARRGYFTDGLSGMQFIREKDFSAAVFALENPMADDIIWIHASDPLQAWGKFIPHLKDREFTNIAAAAVALKAGRPVAILEKSGKALRIFEDDAAIFPALAKAYKNKNIFHSQKKMTIKEYPESAADALKDAGFIKAMADYTIYRGY
jgi:ATP-dependent Lhr-like helicase